MSSRVGMRLRLRLGAQLPLDLISNEVPETISDLEAWFRPDYGVTLSGSDVSSWLDKTGAHTASGGTSPGYTAEDSNFNNRPTVNFASGSSEYLRCDTLTSVLAANNPITAVAVMRRVLTGTMVLLSCGDLSSDVPYYAWYINTGNQHGPRRADSGGNTLVTSTTGTSDGVATWCVHTINGSGSTAIETGGAADGSGTITRAPTGQDAVAIGAFQRTGLQNYFNGDLAELIIYSRALGAAELDQLDSYISARYGL